MAERELRDSEREGFEPSRGDPTRRCRAGTPILKTVSLAARASLMSLSRVREAFTNSEREGFEPSRGSSPLLAFQASTFNRSATSPNRKVAVPGPLLVAVALGMLLVSVAAAPDEARHAVAGHYNVAHPHVVNSLTSDPSNLISNSSFETGNIDRGWYQCGDVSAFTTMAHPYAGLYNEYSGMLNGTSEPLGNSGVCQLVTIPRGALLTARLYQLSDESDTSFAYQEGDLIDDRGNLVVNLFKTVNDKSGWVLGRWNLDAYAGRTLWLYFGVHGDGHPKSSTQQFLDDVVLTAGNAPSP